MLKQKKYRMIDFVTIAFKIAPLQTTFTILYKIINALMPSLETLATAYFINSAINIFEGNTDFSSIYSPVLLIVFYLLFTNLMPSISEMIKATGQNKFDLELSKDIIKKRSNLEYKHIENKTTQDLIDRVCTNATENFNVGLDNILEALNLFLKTISLIIIILSVSFISGIVIIAISIPLFYIAIRTGRKNYQSDIETKKIKRTYNYLAEVLTDKVYLEERKLFSYSNSIQNRYEKIYNESLSIEKKMEIKSYINLKSGSIITLLISLFIIAVLLPSLQNGQLSIGLFISLVYAILNLVHSMSWQLTSTMRYFSRLNEYLRDFTAFMKLSEKKDASVLPTKMSDFSFESIEFRNVSFRYPGTDRYILKDCSFTLHNNKNYSFVGVNGAGKSTIVKLLTGMYDEFDGVILINDKEIKDYDYAEIKGLISVVFQDYMKYSLTIKDNITLGDVLHDNRDDVEETLSIMGLKETVDKFEFGIDTYLGKIKDNSRDLSGGQWQRLTISRLLYSNSPINILDEPTSSLDPIAESKVYQLFNQINKHRFTISITHRLGAAKIADQILVLDKGKIAEQGTHTQLMQDENGIYRKMFDSQKSWYQIGKQAQTKVE